uniref:Ricin B-type lectin domain-containing protein n=1 Tax=Mesocestoides corti TaxID=53468 RepID=A0A5K3EHP7_MESCO
MVKSARLTWGLSLCRLKIPSFLLDTGLGKHALSTSSITPPAVSFKGTARCQRHPQPSLKSPRSQNSPNNSDDIELALIITPSQLASHCTNAGPPITSAGVSDPRMRFIVYLVSLALSLAALSILKLHKLLEWLIMPIKTRLSPSRCTILQPDIDAMGVSFCALLTCLTCLCYRIYFSKWQLLFPFFGLRCDLAPFASN